MNPNTIKLLAKTVYGNDLLYPNNKAAEVVTTLLGRKTIRKTDVILLKRLGHDVEIEGHLSNELTNLEDKNKK